MARDGSVLVKFLADTLGFRRGTDDMVDALDDAARATEHDTDKMAAAFRQAGQKIDRTTKQVGDDTKHNMKEAGAEAGGEFIQNLGEGIGSGAPNLTDAVLGTIGGIAPALGAAGVGIAIGATAIIGIVRGIQEGQKQVTQSAMDLFDAMRQGIVDQAAKENLLEQALGVDNMYDAMAKVTTEAQKLGVPVKDVLGYLESAGRVSTPALTAALAAADAQTVKIKDKSGQIHEQFSEAGSAAHEIKTQAGFTADAWAAAAVAAEPFTQQMKDAAYYAGLASERGKAYAAYAAAQYAAGNPAYGGTPGGKRK